MSNVAMPIVLDCSCGKQIRAADDSAGKTVTCPNCGGKVKVPEPTHIDEELPARSESSTNNNRPGKGRVEPPTLEAAAPSSHDSGCEAATLDSSSQQLRTALSLKGEFGDYELIQEIARGGMGIVFLARQKSLNRVVALKMILAGQLASADQVRRFRIEAEEAGQLDHPNIVPIYHVGERNGQHYFAMKLIEGDSLNAKLEAYRKSPRAAARLISAVARAVHHAHQRGVLHRDLKPGNILIDADGQPHVTDFGLAKHMGGEGGDTQSGAILGTPGYMAPEQAAGKKDLSVAVDVHGLGAILYELLCDRPPFTADTTMAVIMQVMNQDAVPLRHRNPRVPADLETICHKCLEKEPTGRYASAACLADDLDRYLADEPILARPVGRIERARKWARRRPAAAAILAMSAVAAVALSVGGWWYSDRLQRALNKTEESERAALAARDEATAEREKATLARDEATAARDQATTAFERGLTTLDDLIINLDGRLANKEGAASLRVEFLQEFLNISLAAKQERPNDPKARRQLGRVWARIGDVSLKVRQFSRGDEAFKNAVPLLQGLIAEFPAESRDRVELASAHSQHAKLLLARKKYEAARQAILHALEVQQRLVADFPNKPEFRPRLGRFRFELGNVLEEAGKVKEARAAYVEALAAMEQVVQDEPKNALYHGYLAKVADGMAALVAKEEPAEAQRLLERALAANKEADRLGSNYTEEVQEAYTLLGHHLLGNGKHAELARLADSLAGEATDSRSGNYDAACLMAMASEAAGKRPETKQLADGYGERAVRLLQKAVQAGYAALASSRDHIESDSDLNSLRQRADYKDLIAKVDERLPPRASTPQQQYESIVREYTSAWSGYRERYNKAVTPAQEKRATEMGPSFKAYAERCFELAEKHKDSGAALEALCWVLQITAPDGKKAPQYFETLRSKALAVIERDHMNRDDLSDLCLSLGAAADPAFDRLLRVLSERHAKEQTRGMATYALGLSLSQQSSDSQSRNSDRARSLSAEAEVMFKRVSEQYAKVAQGSNTLGELANKKLEEVRFLSVGCQARDITGKDLIVGKGLGDKALSLRQMRGKVVLLDFWANWCGYCRMEYDNNNSLIKQFKDKPFVLVGVNVDEQKEEARRAVDRYELGWSSWYDGANGRIHRDWQVDSFPTTYLIDHKGVIRYKRLSGAKLEAAVKHLLAEAEADQTKTKSTSPKE